MSNQSTAYPVHASIDEWIQGEAIPFSLDSADAFNAAVDKLVASIGDTVQVLGLGEPLHGGEDFLTLRNSLFQRLVETHGYSAIAIESSFPKGHAINEYIAGRGVASYDAVKDVGFSHGFGQLDANRELVEWMRQYNADPTHTVKTHFYGFDSPTESTDTDSPRQLLTLVLDFLTDLDPANAHPYRQRIEPLLGQDTAWENPAAMMDPAQAVGLSPEANALRSETESLISELLTRRPELVAKSDKGRYLEALQFASEARQLLNYHAELARASDEPTARMVRLLGIRDAIMADNVDYIAAHERDRGKVLLFAHNSHLPYGKSEWQLGPNLLTWWPLGAHLREMFGAGYCVIGSGLGVSADNGIGQPDEGTLEARLMAAPGSARFIPTHKGRSLPTAALDSLPTRSGSNVNFSYFALTPQSLTDFDWLVVLNSTAYWRGWPPLPEQSSSGD